jgi:hypothetical protein
MGSRIYSLQSPIIVSRPPGALTVKIEARSVAVTHGVVEDEKNR